MAGHDDSLDDAIFSYSETGTPPRAADDPSLSHDQSTGADPSAFAFVSATGHASIRNTAENAIAQEVRRGTIFLFFIGGAQLAFMLFVTIRMAGEFGRLNQPLAFGDNPADRQLIFLAWGLGLMVGGTFVGLGFWARRDPVLAPKVGLGLYVAANLVDIALSTGYGIMLLPGGWPWFWVFRGVFVVFLLDAIRAGVAYKRIVNRMIEEMRREH